MPEKATLEQEVMDLVAEALGGEPDAELAKALEAVEKAKLEGKAAEAAKMALRLLGKYKDQAGLKDVVKALVELLGEKYGYPEPKKVAKVKLEGEAADAAKMALRLLGKYKDQAGLKDVVKALVELLGEEYGYPEPKKVAKAEIDPETQAQIDMLIKSKEKLETEIQKAQADAAHERDLRLQREYLEKAQSFKNVPGKPEELAAILKRLAEKDPELYGKVEGLLAGVNTSLEKSALLQEFGTSQVRETAGTAAEEVMRLASELVQKSGGKLDFPQAVAQVEKTAPDLYLRYTQEARHRGG